MEGVEFPVVGACPFVLSLCLSGGRRVPGGFRGFRGFRVFVGSMSLLASFFRFFVAIVFFSSFFLLCSF